MWQKIRKRLSSKDRKTQYLDPQSLHSESVPASSVANSDRGRTPSLPTPLPLGTSERPRSPYSSFRGRSPIPDQRLKDELGLHVVYRPPSPQLLDIVFVHGLGGASRRTWSKYQDPELFWPQQWLPLESDTCNARIMTFGYNSSFRSGGPQNTNLADFAKELLFEMRYGKDDTENDLEMGKVPILFIVHSMGGLVVKKAYLLGQNDQNYQSLVASISGVVFLSTPHRGTNLAELLNRIMQVSLQSSKEFILELKKASPAIEDINEQFRHVAPRLSLASFYETLPTSVGPKRLMVLEKQSSILGYPGEISRSLNADHHDVCKYTSPNDTNYKIVRNILQSLVKKLASMVPEGRAQELDNVKKLLSDPDPPENDIEALLERRAPGTCEWLLSNPEYESWRGEESGSRILWMTATPGSGKSVLSAFIVSSMREASQPCQYFTFKHDDNTKSSLTSCLRSIGVQMAESYPAVRQALSQLLEEGLSLEKRDARYIWQKVFVPVLYRTTLSETMVWVLDALDECDSPKILLELLQSLSTSCTPVRLFVTSRKTESLLALFNRSTKIPVTIIDKDAGNDNLSETRTIIEQGLQHMRGSEDFRRQISDSILSSADGNLLWVHFVLEDILRCHTPRAIMEVIDELPTGMEALYRRMETQLVRQLKKADLSLAKKLLSWIVCAQRPLKVTELLNALEPEFTEFLDLDATIRDICGQFVSVDRGSCVTLVHGTASEYLTKTSDSHLFVDKQSGNAELFTTTITYLLRPDIRSRLTSTRQVLLSTYPFMAYAASSFMYHLRRARSTSGTIVDQLVAFFQGSSVLTWIHLLALLGQLNVLVATARALTWFVDLIKKSNLEKNPLLHRLQDLELLESWSVDLVKITAKFGDHLLHDPSAIYTTIPALCPQNSAIHQQFHRAHDAPFIVTGLSDQNWNDCLATISVRSDIQIWKVLCAGRHLAALTSTKKLFVWSLENFQSACTIDHGEIVRDMCFTSKCDRLVTYGFKTTKLWDISSGELVASTPNRADIKALTMAATPNDTKILVGSDDKIIRCLSMRDINGGWQDMDTGLLQEHTAIEGGVIASPSFMAFNCDTTKIAVAYRGYPLSVWSTQEHHLVSRCRRAGQRRSSNARPSIGWMAVDRVSWSPIIDVLVGLYKDGSVFKWDPIRDENQEMQTLADEIQVSPDGKLFLTSDSNGTIKVWNFAYFSIIYALSSEDLVSSLAFGPDCKSFFDCRGSSINVWEPNSLVRFFDHAETISDTSSDKQTSRYNIGTSEATLPSTDPTTAFAHLETEMVYCTAHESGVVNFRDRSGKLLLASQAFSKLLSIDYLILGEDGKLLIGADVAGTILMQRLSFEHSGSENTTIKMHALSTIKARLDVGAIHQIVLSTDSSKLMVVSQGHCQVWSVENAHLLASQRLANAEHLRWVSHPQQMKYLLGFGTHEAQMIHWDDLSPAAALEYSTGRVSLEGRPSLDNESECEDLTTSLTLLPVGGDVHMRSVHNASLTQDRQHILVEFSEAVRRKQRKRILIFQISQFDLPSLSNNSVDLKPLEIPNRLASRIEVPLGILTGQRFVFLDKDLLRMCSVRLDSLRQANAIKSHYFIPRDWGTSTNLEKSCLLSDGIFMLPKDGEVAVITSNMTEDTW